MNNLILTTLKPLVNNQVGFLKYSGTATTYITFFEILQQGQAYADNTEIATSRNYQIDIFTKGSYTELAKQVIAALKAVGFKRSTENDLYEPDTGYYHKVIRLNYTQIGG